MTSPFSFQRSDSPCSLHLNILWEAIKRHMLMRASQLRQCIRSMSHSKYFNSSLESSLSMGRYLFCTMAFRDSESISIQNTVRDSHVIEYYGVFWAFTVLVVAQVGEKKRLGTPSRHR